MSNNEIVRLNVGGTKYITTKSTLRKYPQSMLGTMFMGNVPLSTDKDGYYFIDRCGHIFQYILQFLRCGKLVLPKNFNELQLLETEADFFQIEDLISALQHHKTEVDDEVHVLLLCDFHYMNESSYMNERSYYMHEPSLSSSSRRAKLFKYSKDTDFKPVALRSYFHVDIRDYLLSDYWVLKEQKTLEYNSAHCFLSLRGIDVDNVFPDMLRARNIKVDVETWIRDRSIDFPIFL